MLIGLIKNKLINMLFNNTFILASSSKSRYKILRNNNLFFSTLKPRCDEEFLKKQLIKKNQTTKKICLELARLKSQSISEIKDNKLVVGSDTAINFNNKLFSKAKNIKDAEKKIRLLSGKTHFIYSAASVFYNNKEVWNTTQKSSIKFRSLSEKDINLYVAKAGKDILSAVGCYQIELMGPNIVESVKGDFFNIMGFPLFPFLSFLKEYKIK